MIMEKPFDHNLPNTKHLNTTIAKVLHKNQIFRINHFLNKKTIQNILTFHFTNNLFKPM